MKIITPQQHEHYWKKGWLVVEKVFSIDEMQELRALSMRQLDRLDKDSIRDFDHSADGQTQSPRKIDTPYLLDEGFRSPCRNAKLLAILEDLIGVEAHIAKDQIFMKPPQHGSAKPWHQDNAYFKCSPADEVVTAWIAMDDADVENGCLHYIDGSHRGAVSPHVTDERAKHNQVIPAKFLDFSKESAAIVKQGGVVFHHSQTMHMSPANTSTRWRRSHATHWISKNVTSQSDVVREAYAFQNSTAALVS